MKTTIRRAIATLTALLLAGSMVICIPVMTWADDYDFEYSSDIEVDPDGHWRNISYGVTVHIADVEVHTNGGYIDHVNEGVSIRTNSRNGTVITNEGSVYTNAGEVSNNHGDVGGNNSYAIVAVNYDDGLVGGVSGSRTDGNNGRVVDNFGAVFNNENGIVEINHGGTVDGGTISMNLGEGTLTGDVNVIKQMWKVVSDVWDNLTTADGTAGDTFVENDSNGDFKDFWLLEEGAVTLSSSDNTKIISGLTTNGDATITDNGNGTWTISGISENIVIDVVFDDAGNPVPIRIRQVTETAEDTGSGSNNADVAAVSATFTAAQIQSMIESAMAESLAKANGAPVTIIDLYFGNDPSLTADAVVALCTGSVAKRCHFTHNGQNFVLFVPVIDTTSVTFQQCLALLDEEPGKQAGPIRLSQILAPVGTGLSQE